MTFRPAGGLYRCSRTKAHKSEWQVIVKEFDPETQEERIVFYHDCPIEIAMTDLDTITYDLDRARVVTWSGSSVGKVPMPLSRGGHS